MVKENRKGTYFLTSVKVNCGAMRIPAEPEWFYLDFDGFFASCEQFAHKALRGKPVGVVPMATGNRMLIACSREAKARGIGNQMSLRDALALCPDLILKPQDPDLYRRCHNELISEISRVAPVRFIMSIDEMMGGLDAGQQLDPLSVGLEMKRRIAAVVGPWIACSIGYGANPLHAKMACKASKPAGNLVWHPCDAEGILATKSFGDVPGIGEAMTRRLWKAKVWGMPELMTKGPRELRALWKSLNGERMWYCLHGYDIEISPSERGQFGHDRVLPPSHRSPDQAREVTRMLLIKAARRLRREGFRASRLSLHVYQVSSDRVREVKQATWLSQINDYSAGLHALDRLWLEVRPRLDRGMMILSAGVSLSELTPAAIRQLDLIEADDDIRRDHEAISGAMDKLNHRYGRTLVSLGPWSPPKSDHTGAKISYTRIPRREDFN